MGFDSSGPRPDVVFGARRGRVFACATLALGTLTLAAAMLPANPARAQGLSLHDAVQAAWSRLPDRSGVDARRAAAAARGGAGSAFFPNAPFVTGSYVNDALGSNQRYLTYQAEVSTPVWLPGQGRATVAAGQAEVSSLDAEGEALHLSLARQVLDAASQAALAENARTAAGRRLQAAQVLAADLNRRFRVGEAAQSDALAADADVANAAVTLADAAAQLAAAQATLAALTGSTSVPSLSGGAAAVPGLDALRQVHPRLVAARRLVDAAQSSLRLTRLDTRDSPEIGVQGIHEKQGAATPYNTRFGVVVRFPFATQARNAPRIAAAEAQVTAAEVQQVQAERQVLAELQSAQGALEAARQGSAAATRAAGSLTTRRGQIERAWRAGEMPLIEVLRANAVAFDAELVRDKSRTVLQASQQRLQIAAGLLP